jgi:hypothetical protein
MLRVVGPWRFNFEGEPQRKIRVKSRENIPEGDLKEEKYMGLDLKAMQVSFGENTEGFSLITTELQAHLLTEYGQYFPERLSVGTALVHKSWTEGEAVSGDVTDEGSDLRLCR